MDITQNDYPDHEIFPSTLVTDKIIDISLSDKFNEYGTNTFELINFDGEYLKGSDGVNLYRVDTYQNKVQLDNIPNLCGSTCIEDDYINDEYLTLDDGLDYINENSVNIEYKANPFDQEEQDLNWCFIDPHVVLRMSPLNTNIKIENNKVMIESEDPIYIGESVHTLISSERENNLLYEGVLGIPSTLIKKPLILENYISTSFIEDITIDTKMVDVYQGNDPDTNEPIIETQELPCELLKTYTTDSLNIQCYKNPDNPFIYLKIKRLDNVQIIEIEGIFEDINFNMEDNNIIMSAKCLQSENETNGLVGHQVGFTLFYFKLNDIYEQFTPLFTGLPYTNSFLLEYIDVQNENNSTVLKNIKSFSLYKEETNSITKYFWYLDEGVLKKVLESESVEFFSNNISNLEIVNFKDKEYKFWKEDGLLKYNEGIIKYSNLNTLKYSYNFLSSGILDYSSFEDDIQTPVKFKVQLLQLSPEIQKEYKDSLDNDIIWYITIFKFSNNNTSEKLIFNSFYKDKFGFKPLSKTSNNILYEYNNELNVFYPSTFDNFSNYQMNSRKNINIIYIRSGNHSLKINLEETFSNIINILNIEKNLSENKDSYYKTDQGLYQAELFINSFHETSLNSIKIYRLPQIEFNIRLLNKEIEDSSLLNENYNDFKQKLNLAKIFKFKDNDMLSYDFNNLKCDTRGLVYDVKVIQHKNNPVLKNKINTFINLRKFYNAPLIDIPINCVLNEPIIIDL